MRRDRLTRQLIVHERLQSWGTRRPTGPRTRCGGRLPLKLCDLRWVYRQTLRLHRLKLVQGFDPDVFLDVLLDDRDDVHPLRQFRLDLRLSVLLNMDGHRVVVRDRHHLAADHHDVLELGLLDLIDRRLLRNRQRFPRLDALREPCDGERLPEREGGVPELIDLRELRGGTPGAAGALGDADLEELGDPAGVERGGLEEMRLAGDHELLVGPPVPADLVHGVFGAAGHAFADGADDGPDLRLVVLMQQGELAERLDADGVLSERDVAYAHRPLHIAEEDVHVLVHPVARRDATVGLGGALALLVVDDLEWAALWHLGQRVLFREHFRQATVDDLGYLGAPLVQDPLDAEARLYESPAPKLTRDGPVLEVVDAGAVFPERSLDGEFGDRVGYELLAVPAEDHDPTGRVRLTGPVVAVPDKNVFPHLPDVPSFGMLGVHVVAGLAGAEDVESDHVGVRLEIAGGGVQLPCLVDVHGGDGRFPREVVVVVNTGRYEQVPAGQDVPFDPAFPDVLELECLPLRLRLGDDLSLLLRVEDRLPVHVRDGLEELALGGVEPVVDGGGTCAGDELLEELADGPVAFPFVVPAPGVRVVDLVRVRRRLHVVLAEQHLHQELVSHELTDRRPDVLADGVDGLPFASFGELRQDELALGAAEPFEPLGAAGEGCVHPPSRFFPSAVSPCVFEPLSPDLNVASLTGRCPPVESAVVGSLRPSRCWRSGVGTHRLPSVEWAGAP